MSVPGERHRASTVTARWAPAWTDALEGLLAGEDERLVARVHQPGAAGGAGPDPGRAPPRGARRRSSGAGSRRSSPTRPRPGTASCADGHTIVTTGTASGKSLCFNLPVLHMLAGDPRARALYLYPTKALAQDQARSLAGAAHAGAAARDLRRRHAAGRARGDPPAREPGAHQSGHAARRDPAPPRRLGRLPREPGARGRGRGARLPGRVRLARRQRPAAAAAARRRLRDAAALRAHLGHDREPAVARAGADRPRVRPRRAGRLARAASARS